MRASFQHLLPPGCWIRLSCSRRTPGARSGALTPPGSGISRKVCDKHARTQIHMGLTRGSAHHCRAPVATREPSRVLRHLWVFLSPQGGWTDLLGPGNRRPPAGSPPCWLLHASSLSRSPHALEGHLWVTGQSEALLSPARVPVGLLVVCFLSRPAPLPRAGGGEWEALHKGQESLAVLLSMTEKEELCLTPSPHSACQPYRLFKKC